MRTNTRNSRSTRSRTWAPSRTCLTARASGRRSSRCVVASQLLLVSLAPRALPVVPALPALHFPLPGALTPLRVAVACLPPSTLLPRSWCARRWWQPAKVRRLRPSTSSRSSRSARRAPASSRATLWPSPSRTPSPPSAPRSRHPSWPASLAPPPPSSSLLRRLSPPSSSASRARTPTAGFFSPRTPTPPPNRQGRRVPEAHVLPRARLPLHPPPRLGRRHALRGLHLCRHRLHAR